MISLASDSLDVQCRPSFGLGCGDKTVEGAVYLGRFVNAIFLQQRFDLPALLLTHFDHIDAVSYHSRREKDEEIDLFDLLRSAFKEPPEAGNIPKQRNLAFIERDIVTYEPPK